MVVWLITRANAVLFLGDDSDGSTVHPWYYCGSDCCYCGRRFPHSGPSASPNRACIHPSRLPRTTVLRSIRCPLLPTPVHCGHLSFHSFCSLTVWLSSFMNSHYASSLKVRHLRKCCMSPSTRHSSHFVNHHTTRGHGLHNSVQQH